MKKSEVYAKYGIKYDAKTQKIETPIGPMRELLKAGNSKVGKAVKTWSMDQTTCACHCKGCYGDSGFYRTASVRKSLANNTRLAREHLEFLERAIRAQLETLPAGTEIRIHAPGDFFSDEYADMWKRIARDFPGTVFWTYTKREKYEGLFDDLDNANIVKSLVNGQFNFGHCGHVLDLYKDLKSRGESVHICRCGVDDNQHCAGCHECSISKYVLFIEHSTDYKAKEDPLFPALSELIENQK